MVRDYLLCGAIYCMENARLFIREGIILFRKGSYAPSCVLGAIAAEHLGQCNWLLCKWDRAKKTLGKMVCTEFEEEFKRKHERMLKDGLVALQYSIRPSESFETLTTLKAGTPEYEREAERLDETHQKIRARFPKKYLDLRVSAQYVKPSNECDEWNRPGLLGQTQAHDL